MKHDTPRHTGFTLIELMVTIAILGILVAFGLPSFQTWNGNLEIRNLAQSIQDGLRMAQLEATKRNTQVDFVMTANDLVSSAENATPTASNTGKSWVVRQGTTFIQGKSLKQGSNSTSIEVRAPTPSTGFTGEVSFNGLGRTNLTSNVTLRINSSKGDRPLEIQISTGGKIRMCNPAFSSGDPQGCN